MSADSGQAWVKITVRPLWPHSFTCSSVESVVLILADLDSARAEIGKASAAAAASEPATKVRRVVMTGSSC